MCSRIPMLARLPNRCREWGPAILLFSILLGPIGALSISGRTPNLFWCDVLLLALFLVEVRSAVTRGEPLAVPGIGLFLPYLLLASASLLEAIDPLVSLAALKLRVMAALAYWYFALWSRRSGNLKDLGLWVTAFGGLLGLLIIWNFQQGLRGVPVGPDPEAVVASTKDLAATSFGRSNYLASLLILVMPVIGTVFYLGRALAVRVLVGATAVACGVALLITQSRGGILSLIAGLVAAVGLGVLGSRGRAPSARRPRAGPLLIVAALVIAGSAWLTPPDAVQDLGATSEFLVEQWQGGELAGNRQAIWKAGLDHVLDRPILGLGLGNQQVAQAHLGMEATTHNLYLDTALELGATGLLALVALLVAIGLRLHLAWRTEAQPEARSLRMALLASYLIALVNAFEEPSFWGAQYAITLWFMLGLGCASLPTAQENTPRG